MVFCISKEKSTIAFIVFMIEFSVILLLTDIGISQNLQDNRLQEEVSEIAVIVADISTLESNSEPNIRVSRSNKMFDTLSKTKELLLDKSLFRYKAECLLHTGIDNEAMNLVKKQIDQNDPAKPDLIFLLIKFIGEGGGDKARARMEALDEYGRILPISLQGSNRDEQLTGPITTLMDIEISSVPSYNIIKITPADKEKIPSMGIGVYNIQDILVEIAKIYDENGFVEEAINSYIEAFYAMPTSDNPQLRGDIWLRVGEIEEKRGNKELAIRSYFNAVYNWNKYIERAKNGLIRLLNESDPNNINSIPKLGKDTAITISTLYSKLNLHPLALGVLERSEKDTGENLSKEKQEILDEWNSILKRLGEYYRVTRSSEAKKTNFYVLGQKVSEVKDWAKIKILRPTYTFWKAQE